jgi:Asp-tRNA(Asn)/Glu-tRNA(Gln) amidotransferase A subunit family amidase
MMEKLELVEKRPASLVSLSSEQRTGKLSPIDCLTRLERLFDEREPRIQAFVLEAQSRFERLRIDLDNLIIRYPNPTSRPSLFGIPVGIKNILHVDGFPTQAGSKLPSEVIGGPEAAVVKKLKSTGALILGKTVTVEFAIVHGDWFREYSELYKVFGNLGPE